MGWILEVNKMVLYMAFPVGLFHYFNQPEYYEKYVIEKKREMYPHEDESGKKEIETLIQLIRTREDEKAKKAMETDEADRKFKGTQSL